MMAQWTECTLGDIVELVIDYRGKTPKKLGGGWSQTGYRALSAKNIKTGRIVEVEAIRFVDEELYHRWMKKEIVRGDILITSEAPFGQVYLWDSDEKIVLSQRLFGVRVRREEVCPAFLYYYMTSPAFQEELASRATGTTVTGLRQPELLNCKVRYPDMEHQEQIASALLAVDAKIRLNESMNNNLEQQASALFRQWFIENPSAGEWKNGTFSDLVTAAVSGDWGKEAPVGNYTEMVYCIRGADIPEVRAGSRGKMPCRFILPKNRDAKQLAAGDIVVEISGGSPAQSTGRAAAVSRPLLDRYGRRMICTNFCKALKPKLEYSMFVYHYWQYLYDRGVFFSYENGTTGIKNLDLTGFLESEPITIPPMPEVIRFNEICDAVFAQIYANGRESEQLQAVRDTILPELMSGGLPPSGQPFVYTKEEGEDAVHET